MRSRYVVTLVALLVVPAVPRSAHALQPLADFVAAGAHANPGNAEARARTELASARAATAVATLLPSASVTASYTHNQYESAFGDLTIFPRNQLDAIFTVRAPIVDAAKIADLGAARRSELAATESKRGLELRIEGEIVRGYYELAAGLALVRAAERAEEAARKNLVVARARERAGAVTALDADRAAAEVARQEQLVASARLAARVAAIALERDTGLAPDTATGADVVIRDDLAAEPPPSALVARAGSTPELRAARAAREGAERAATARRLALVPTLTGTATQRFTNASGFFAGHEAAFVGSIALGWNVDGTTFTTMRERDADVAAARAREDRTGRAIVAEVARAASTVDASIARSRAARAEAAVTARAAEEIRARYGAGSATQLELVQADRDAFAAEAARIRSDAQLAGARAELRLALGLHAGDAL